MIYVYFAAGFLVYVVLVGVTAAIIKKDDQELDTDDYPVVIFWPVSLPIVLAYRATRAFLARGLPRAFLARGFPRASKSVRTVSIYGFVAYAVAWALTGYLFGAV